jgi:membrane associated rhomboid family serine protease
VLYAKAYAWIRLASLLVWITPMPIPIRSEAYGSRKPYAIWSIAILTVICSLAFFIAQNSGGSSDNLNRPGNELMLWSPWGSGKAFDIHSIDPAKIHGVAEKMTDEDREKLRAKYDPEGKLSDDQLITAVLAGLFNSRHGEFHWYQLLTHAFLHDTGSVYGFAMHLGGNMLFLLVFGTRVNALIGDLATAIAYPILAVCAATAHLLASGTGLHGPMLGASGAIMGLAGMYLILFPVHRVLCAMWISLWFWFRRLFGCKLFFVRGFWVLLIYFGYDILMSAINSHFGMGGGVAHWAHIGGFTTGMILGLTILFSRQFETNGGDLLSVMLGKNAWSLVGKPSRWIIRRQTAMLPPALMG